MTYLGWCFEEYKKTLLPVRKPKIFHTEEVDDDDDDRDDDGVDAGL